MLGLNTLRVHSTNNWFQCPVPARQREEREDNLVNQCENDFYNSIHRYCVRIANNKKSYNENPYNWTLLRGIHLEYGVSITKCQWCTERFHPMTPLCYIQAWPAELLCWVHSLTTDLNGLTKPVPSSMVQWQGFELGHPSWSKCKRKYISFSVQM